ncbi:TauD/TfdA family dioxygenase [Streptomyces sp. NPDC047985]|uniref:TauD/TfdA family dioxygenase n=1 Tax=unclassified Streptomyces TaxID=2593676 RepID=UPI003438C31D
MASLKIADDEAEDISRLTARLVGHGTAEVDDPRWIDATRAAWDELPLRLRQSLRAFRRHSGPSGVLLVEGLPLDGEALPATPSAFDSVQRYVSAPAALLTMIAAGLGDPAAFLAEKSGALVQDVVPVKGREEFQGNAGSVALELHNENAFHEHRPDHVMLMCLRPDHDGAAGLITASIRDVLPTLPAELVQDLFAADYVTPAPPSFGTGTGEPPRHAILSGATDDPDLRVDFAATRGVTAHAQEALGRLRDAMLDVVQTHYFNRGDIAIVDNHVAAHGRTEFRPRYDGGDRWLQRTFVLSDMRRSRAHRPGDGQVLTR